MSYQQELQELMKLRKQVADISAVVESKERVISEQESRIRQNIVPTTGARALERNVAAQMGPLAPANVGEMNKIAWPFFFSTDRMGSQGISQGQTLQSNFNVTQEAAFILMSYTKCVYKTNQPAPNTPWNYIDPNIDGLEGQAPGLYFTLRDASSMRQFFNSPIPLGAYGNPNFPSKLPRPIMLLPNQMMEVSFQNTHPSNVYLPQLTFFGYRIRLEDSQRYLSLIHG